MLIRLQKILSAAGVASRRAAERLMSEGRVTVNGETVRELGTRADPGRDDIRVDGRAIRRETQRLYLVLNKPRGYVTTRSDPEGRPTVLDLVPKLHDYVYPVGRLDYDSEGLLILTNDGELAAALTHPSHEVAREYHARVRGVPDARAISRLARGVVLDGRKTAQAEVSLVASGVGQHADQSLLSITLHEGRTRQVRRVCEAVGHQVVRLRRVRFGPLRAPDLKPGMCRPLTAAEVAALRRAAGISRGCRTSVGALRASVGALRASVGALRASVDDWRSSAPTGVRQSRLAFVSPDWRSSVPTDISPDCHRQSRLPPSVPRTSPPRT